MYTATTNLIASSQGADQGVRGMPRTSKNFIAALQLSGVVGTALGSILLCLAVPLLRAIIGNDAIDPAVFSAALRYVRIRALGMPAAAIIGSSQAASLGMQDIKSPLYVLMAAAVINFLGDATLVGNAHPWIGGAAGAAWATVFSQYAAVALFVRWMCHHRPTILVDNPEPRFRIQKFLANHLNRRSTRGFLDGKFRARDFFQLPSKEKVADFTPYIIPVTSTQFGRISSYVAMSHVIASSLGTVNMAAQQVIISIWGCLYPVGESLSLTAQSFTPGIFETKKGPARTKALGKTLRNFWMAGAVLGTAMFGAVLCIPLMNQFFTTDAAVIALVHSVLPRLMMIFSTLGLFTASEGMLLGQKDLNFLGKCYASFFFIIPLLMLRLKRAALSGGTTSSVVTLKSVWTLFTGYQMFRTSLWMLRAMQLQRRTRRREEEEEEVAMSPSSQE
jgi:Na+-driven multidrug efflux pump